MLKVNGIEITEKNAGQVVGNPDEELFSVTDNPFVKNIFGQRIFYTDDFYPAMYKRISDEHMTYVDAYASLGFDVALLGKKRAEQAGKRAVQMAREGKLNMRDPGNYDGSVPLEQMPAMSPEEEAAYLKARVLYLESLVEAQKKIPFALEEYFTSSKKMPTT